MCDPLRDDIIEENVLKLNIWRCDDLGVSNENNSMKKGSFSFSQDGDKNDSNIVPVRQSSMHNNGIASVIDRLSLKKIDGESEQLPS